MKIITHNRFLMESMSHICKGKEFDDLLCVDCGVFLCICPSNIEYNTPIGIIENKLFLIRRGVKLSSLDMFLKNRYDFNLMISLNPMERKILSLLLDGKIKKDISLICGISDKRICSIKNRAFKKLGFRNENEFYVSIFNIKNVFKLIGVSTGTGKQYHHSMS